MTISDIIGLKISKIRYSYELDNESEMQTFNSYIKFSNGSIIFFPSSPDDSINLVDYYNNHKTCQFIKAKRYGLASRVSFKNKKIIDIHFRYLDNEYIESSSAILELENGVFLTENNYGPFGLTDIRLLILNREQFESLAGDGIKIKSLKHVE